MGRHTKKYTQGDVDRVLELRKKGLSYYKIMEETGVAYSTIGVWVKNSGLNKSVSVVVEKERKPRKRNRDIPKYKWKRPPERNKMRDVCKTCMYRNKQGAEHGNCNYMSVTGHGKIIDGRHISVDECTEKKVFYQEGKRLRGGKI